MLADLEARQAEAEDNNSEVAQASGEVQRKFDAARIELKWISKRKSPI